MNAGAGKPRAPRAAAVIERRPERCVLVLAQAQPRRFAGTREVQRSVVLGLDWLTPGADDDPRTRLWRRGARGFVHEVVEEFQAPLFCLRPPSADGERPYQVGLWHQPRSGTPSIPDGAVSLAAEIVAARQQSRWHGLYRLPPLRYRRDHQAARGAEPTLRPPRRPAPPGPGWPWPGEGGDGDYYYIAVLEGGCLDVAGDRVLDEGDARRLLIELASGGHPLSGVELRGDLPEGLLDAAQAELSGGAEIPDTWPFEPPHMPAQRLAVRPESLADLIAEIGLDHVSPLEKPEQIDRWPAATRRAVTASAIAAAVGLAWWVGVAEWVFPPPPPPPPAPPPQPWTGRLAGAAWMQLCIDTMRLNLLDVPGYPASDIKCKPGGGAGEGQLAITFVASGARNLGPALARLDAYRRYLAVQPDGMRIVLTLPVKTRPGLPGVEPERAAGPAQIAWRRRLDQVGLPATIDAPNLAGFALHIDSDLPPSLILGLLGGPEALRSFSLTELSLTPGGLASQSVRISGIVYARSK